MSNTFIQQEYKKTVMCKFGVDCNRKETCAFAHSQSELVVRKCFYGVDCRKAECRFAHPGDKNKSKLYFMSSKGNNNVLTFLNAGRTRIFTNKNNYKGISQYIKQIGQLVSFGYSFHRLNDVVPKSEWTFDTIDIKKAFRKKFNMNEDAIIDRGEMLKKLGYNIKYFEPNYPRAEGSETCKTYRLIYNELGF